MNIDYENSLRKVLNAIEENLDYVTIEELISISGYSYYHFHRIFKTYVGESLKRYIRRLQMQRALLKMQIDQENITQIAISSGFDSSSAFNKSFKKMFGINPSQYRQKLLPQRQLYANILPVRYETVPEIEVYSLRTVGDYKTVDESWTKLINFAKKHSLFGRNFYAYAIAYDNPDIADEEQLRYDACITKTKKVEITVDEKISSKTLAGGKYAVFLHRGDHGALVNTYNSIFGNWLYTQNDRLRDVTVIQKFLNNKYEVTEDKLLTEVYVPII